MLIEFGNHLPLAGAIDGRPKVTRMHIPEADELGLGGYTHEPGMDVKSFVDHVQDAILNRGRIFRLPDHEILIAVTQSGWLEQSGGGSSRAWVGPGDLAPAWVKVTPHEDLYGPVVDLGVDERGDKIVLPKPHGADVAEDIENFLRSYYELPDSAVKPSDLEDRYWTKWGAPGEFPRLPDLTALYTDDGRVMNNNNDGGGQVGITGQATGSGTTSLTNSGATWTSNQWTGYRVYATVSAAVMVWANVISNTGTVLTVDRWYSAATPGGSAGTTPSSTATYMIADGGMPSTWFVGLATGVNAPAHADHTLATGGNAEITTASGGLIRKIAPYAQTSGVASRAYTLIPVFTANGSDSLPATVTTIGCFASMVSSFGGAGGPMKFETALSASATLSLSGDQLTVTETVTGS